MKTTEKGGHGFDAGKKLTGRKRHLVVDTLGLIHGLAVHPANIQDRDGAKLVLAPLIGQMPRLQRIWADAGNGVRLVEWVRHEAGWNRELVAKRLGTTIFAVLPYRWIAERTFAWLGRRRRLSKDYEHLVSSSNAMIRLTMIRLMSKRLARV